MNSATPADAPQWTEEVEPREFEGRILAASRTVRTEIDGGTMAWRIWGTPGRPALVLLHGGFGSWRHWILNVTPLSADHEVFVADLPGLGDSDDLGGAYTAEAVALAVSRGIDALLHPDRAVAIAGFSFGGIIGGHVAALQGRRTSHFVVSGSAALGLDLDGRPELDTLRRGMRPDEVANTHRTNLARLMFADPERVDALAIHLQTETVRLARARSGEIPRSDTLARAMPRIRGRIAGVWGKQDVLSGRYLHQRRALFERIQPGAPFHEVEDAGHWVMYEQPRAYERCLRAVLATR